MVGTLLLPLQRKVRSHVSLLSFHYIQIRSATNFIKSKQSWSENGASTQSCREGRVFGEEKPGSAGEVVVAAVERAGGRGLGRGFPARFSISRDPTTFMDVYILLKLCQHSVAFRQNSRL